MRVALLGGTFDPIHVGHMVIAEEARAKLDLDTVMFVPAGDPWMKRDDVMASPEHRINMVRIAIHANDGLSASSIEIDKAGPSYTTDTLTETRMRYQENDKLFFILGGDAIQDFHLWKNPRDILSQAQLIAVPRPGNARIDMSDLEQKMPGISSKTTILESPLLDISSRNIRERVSTGHSIRHLVQEGVVDYIYKHGLYQTGDTNVRD